MKRGKPFISIMIIIIMVILNIPIVVNADNTLEEWKKAQEEAQQAKDKVNATKGDLVGLEDTKKTFEGQLNVLNAELTIVKNNLEDLENQLDAKEADIEQTSKELAIAKEIEEVQYEAMKQRIKFMYEKGETGYLESMLMASSYSEFLNKKEYIEKLSDYDRKMLVQYQETKARIAAEEEKLLQEKKELDELKVQVEEEQGRVTGLVNATAGQVSATAAEVATTEQRMLEEERLAEEASNKEKELKKKYEEELRLSQLAAQAKWRDIGEVTFAEGDEYLLASIIYCEAGGESFSGQLAVGSVVINRLLSSRYPNTLVGVIYDHKQFSPVLSGRLALAMANNKATPGCYQAAREAMKGVTNVDNCLYFRTPISGVNPKYTIGGHIFY